MPSPGRHAGADPGGGRGLVAREGPAIGAGPWRPQWPGPPPPASLYTAAKFRLRPEFVPIRDAFPPPLPWPSPRARRVYKAWAGPAAARRAVPARLCPTSRSPVSESASASGPGHGAERAHPAVLLHFRQPVSRARPAGGEGGRDRGGGRLRVVELGLRGSRTQAAGMTDLG